MQHLDQTPDFSTAEALEIIQKHFGIEAICAKSLPSERDQNFLISTATKRWVLKISNGQELASAIDGQNQMLAHVANNFDLCPQVKDTLDGATSVVVPGKNDASHIVRIVSFLEGLPLAEVTYRPDELLRSLGEQVAQLTDSLEGFDNKAFRRSFHWDIAEGIDVVLERRNLISKKMLPHVNHCIDDYQHYVQPLLQRLQKSVIHNDANDGNVVVAVSQSGVPPTKVTGLIDFGDAVYSYTVAELAIATAYAILNTDNPLLAACEVVAGYASRRKLSDDEIAAIFGMIRLRMCVSAAMAAQQQAVRPDDEYLSVSQAPIEATLPLLCEVPYPVAVAMLRNAAGLPALPNSKDINDWIQDHHAGFAFPVQRSSSQALLPIDLSAASPLLTGDPSAWAIADVDHAVKQVATESSSSSDGTHSIAIGRYLEPRLLYSGDQYLAGDADKNRFDKERRTIHLGVDLFAPAETPVLAVLDGVVERVDTCDDQLDYGTLVILRHSPAEGITFFSLYGHLSSACRRLVEGQTVKQGQQIAELGPPEDNGGWSPHLHFQLAVDLLDTGHNFPGVCRRSEQHIWSQICPDPSRILGLADATYEAEPQSVKATLARRRKNLGRNLSVGYSKPLKMVRGWKHYLFDESGRRYLDAYNNVPHVGHAHPRIVAALQAQASVLNTNTRYLHDLHNQFAEALCATMPAGLSVCYFLNSASEANELALRLARSATDRKDVIVLEDAYHGHSTSLIDMSPYKHNGPGGSGPPDWVHTAPVADVFRGVHKNRAAAGVEYAADVQTVIRQLDESDRRLCAFIAESCPSVGGQIIFPDGYLKAVYQHVRSAGGICIADEVQTGYGRLGKHFYGFEQQQVTPDIVVLGKPIGNGHPLAAVVTTAAIADAFDNGMEFFSTFGGNCVSCAVGLEVLRTLQDEGLPQNAATVGGELLTALSGLKDRYSIVGDVRGLGLFVGVELVRDPVTLEPATEEAAFVANRMRDRGVLLGTDGPHHSVVKIRPPMTFDADAAQCLVSDLEKTISEIPSIGG